MKMEVIGTWSEIEAYKEYLSRDNRRYHLVELDTNITEYPKKIGVDISTFHAAKSFLYNERNGDPWGERCFAQLADFIINLDRVIVRMPSKAALQSLNDKKDYFLPQTLRYFSPQWVHAVPDDSGDDYWLPDATLRNLGACLLDNLRSETAPERRKGMLRWIEYITTDPQIDNSLALDGYRKDEKSQTVDCSAVTEFRDRAQKLFVGDVAEIAFLTYIKAAQYHVAFALNGIGYVPHPYRETAIGAMASSIRSVQGSQIYRWSWGKYLANLFNSKAYKKKSGPQRLTLARDLISRIRDGVRQSNATWSGMKDDSAEDQEKKVIRTADDSCIPGWPSEKIKMAVQAAFTGVGAVTEISVAANDNPYVKAFGLAFKLAEIAVDSALDRPATIPVKQIEYHGLWHG